MGQAATPFNASSPGLERTSTGLQVIQPGVSAANSRMMAPAVAAAPRQSAREMRQSHPSNINAFRQPASAARSVSGNAPINSSNPVAHPRRATLAQHGRQIHREPTDLPTCSTTRSLTAPARPATPDTRLRQRDVRTRPVQAVASSTSFNYNEGQSTALSSLSPYAGRSTGPSAPAAPRLDFTSPLSQVQQYDSQSGYHVPAAGSPTARQSVAYNKPNVNPQMPGSDDIGPSLSPSQPIPSSPPFFGRNGSL